MKHSVSIPYILFYILVPVILYALSIILLLSGDLTDNYWIFIPTLICSLIMVLWFMFVPMIVPNIFRKSAYRKLMKSGFRIEREYKTFTYTLLIDISGGKVAMLFPFNPFTASVAPANCIQRIWVSDGKSVTSNRTGCVCVNFVIGNKITVFNTYCQKVGKGAKVYLPMNHPVIIGAIQKANRIAFELNEAWKNSSRFR